MNKKFFLIHKMFSILKNGLGQGTGLGGLGLGGRGDRGLKGEGG